MADQPTIIETITNWRAAGVTQFVYFVQEGDDGPVKIGTAIDPEQRLAGLQGGNPRQLTIRHIIPGDWTVENSLHLRFHESRLIGEWFGGGGIERIILAWAQGMHDRALAYLAEKGAPPVVYNQDQEPVGALDRDLIRQRLRAAKQGRLQGNALDRYVFGYNGDLPYLNLDREWTAMRREAA